MGRGPGEELKGGRAQEEIQGTGRGEGIQEGGLGRDAEERPGWVGGPAQGEGKDPWGGPGDGSMGMGVGVQGTNPGGGV